MTAGSGAHAARLTATCRRVADAVAGLDATTAHALVVQVAGHPRALWDLHEHLAAHPDALVSGSADQAPPSLIRLAKALAAQGFPDVRVPACLGCGRTDRELPGRVPGGRLCQPCYHKATAKVCCRCGRTRPVQGVCEQGPLCDRCAGRPQRPCGRCGKVRPVGRRATDTTPDLCQECARTQTTTCAVCGRTRSCRRISDGRRLCPGCVAATRAGRQPCYRCGRRRPVLAHWPAGPVCHACYERVLSTPATCPACGRRAVLTGTGPDGQAICARCAGSTRTYDCPDCCTPCRPLRGGRCARRVLTDRLHDLLAIDEHPELAPLAATLCTADPPRAVLRWLGGPTGVLLTDLAGTGQLTHDALDVLPAGNSARYLRSLLVATGVLPARDDYVERVAAGLERTLAGQPAHRAALVRQYATWDVLTRARRRHDRRDRTSTSATSQYLRQKIHVALDFLTWLDEHALTLDRLTQPDLELYLAERVTTKPLAGFISWLRRRHLVHAVAMPRTPRRAQPTPIPEPDRWQHLQRCLTDEDLPLPVRVAAALLLLFGNPVTHTVALTTDALQHDGDRHYLTLADRPVLLPPALADLLTRLHDQSQPPSGLARSVTAGSITASTWLFPGRHPGRHREGAGFTTILAAHGIDVRPARTAALMALAEQLPAAVLGPLLGLHPHTAIAWTTLVKRDWTDYLAARTGTAHDGRA